MSQNILKPRDIEGLQPFVRYIEKIKYQTESGPFTFVNGIITDSLSIGYPTQIMEPSYQLDVRGSMRLTENAFFHKNLTVSNQTVLNDTCTIRGNVFLDKTIQIKGALSTEQDLIVKGICNIGSNVSVLGDTVLKNASILENAKLNTLNVLGLGLFESNVSVLGNTQLNTTTIKGTGVFLSNVSVLGTTFLQNVSVLGANDLNTLNVKGLGLFDSNVSVLGTAYLQNTSVLGNTELNTLSLKGTSTLTGDVNIQKLIVENEIRIKPNAKIVYEQDPVIENRREITSIQMNISSLGYGPALRVGQKSPTYSNILLLEGDGRDVFTVGDMGNTQILGKIRLGYNVMSIDSFLNNSSYDITGPQPFGDNQLDVSGNSLFKQNVSVGGSLHVQGTTNMEGLLTLKNDLTSYSDRRIKKNLSPLTDCLDSIDHIHGYRYQRIDCKEDQHCIGLIAQEIETYYPELVTDVSLDNGIIKTVNYQAFSGVLLECIRELKEKIRVLENKIFA
jgi:cytoskeletal protein CcmA (bactofilin family)